MIPAPPSRPLPPGVRLRPLRAADLEEVARLEAGLFGGEAWSGDLLARELARSGGAGADRRYVVVEEGPDGGGGILGYAGVWLGDGRGDADLLTIATAPRARRRGLAAAMLRELIGLARAAGWLRRPAGGAGLQRRRPGPVRPPRLHDGGPAPALLHRPRGGRPGHAPAPGRGVVGRGERPVSFV